MLRIALFLGTNLAILLLISITFPPPGRRRPADAKWSRP